MNSDRIPMPLPGLDGTNPLAFLAALGLIRIVDSQASLAWQETDARAVLFLDRQLSDRNLLLKALTQGLLQAKACLEQYPSADSPANVIKVMAVEFSKFSALGLSNPWIARFAAAFGSEASRDRSDISVIAPNRLSRANGNGGKKLLLQFRDMINTASCCVTHSETRLTTSTSNRRKSIPAAATLSDLVAEAIFEWKPRDGANFYSFRWDPAELRRYAHMARKPEDDKYWPVPGANLLAVLGLTVIPTAPTSGGLRTACLCDDDSRELFVWPLWNDPLTLPTIMSLLGQSPKRAKDVSAVWSRERGIFARYASERFTDPQKNAYLNSSFAM